MELCIFSTVNQIEADMVKNALDENKIDNYLKNKSANTLGLGGWTVVFGAANLAFGDIKVMVKEEDKEKALEIVKTLFGDDEEVVDINESEETATSSNDLEFSDENCDTEETTEKNIDDNEKTSKKKKNPKRKFFVFFGIVLFIMIAFTIFINIPPQPKNDKIETKIRYYYEMFTIPIAVYDSTQWPEYWTLNAMKDLRNELRAQGSQLWDSTANASEDDIFTLFTNSGYTPTETKDIIADINAVGNYIIFGKYTEDENYIKVTYFEKF
jgi:hypothetical protein